MIRRLLVPFLFVTCGFVGGMVLTGRLRTAEEARAEPRPADPPLAGAGRHRRRLPDLSGIAAKTIPSVMNITSLQVVRTQNSPFASDPMFRYFFGDPRWRRRATASRRASAPASSSRTTATSSPTTTSSATPARRCRS